MDQTLWIAWAVLFAELIALGFVGFWFSLWTLRLFTGVTAFILAIVVTRFGLLHPEYSPANLVDSFLSGVDQLTQALLHPLWPGRVPVPGVAGRWIIAAALLLGYRELEAWTLHWQAPELDLSAIGRGRPAPAPAAAAHGHGSAPKAGGPTPAQLHAQLAAELRFRLTTMEVRSPAILPGGTKANALASIAETSGVGGAGMIGAVFRLAGMIWPGPRQIRVRTWVEPSAANRISVLLEDVKTGLPVATNTVTGAKFSEAASMVAGYIARQVFAMDRSVPDWCYGTADGRDLGAMQLARLERVYIPCPEHMAESRDAQICTLEKATGIARTAGIIRYELAQLLALRRQNLESLRLHAVNRELHPRFFRGRYRFASSLEMLANPEHYLPDVPATWDTLDDVLRILFRGKLTKHKPDLQDELRKVDVVDSQGRITQCLQLSTELAIELLRIARNDLRDVRKQLTPLRVVRDALFRRDERAVWLPHWRHRYRQAFHDGVCVAELFVAIRCRLLERDVNAQQAGGTKQQQAKWIKRKRDHWHLRHAARITSFIVGDRAIVNEVLENPDGQWWDAKSAKPEPRTRPRARCRARWLPGQRCTASWQAAYNTACLYAALADTVLADTELAYAALPDATLAELALAETAMEREALAGMVLAAHAGTAPEKAALLREALADIDLAGRADAVLENALKGREVLRDLEDRVVKSLRSAVDNPRSELERASDWIKSDPDLNFMCQRPEVFDEFARFVLDQEKQDYPVAFISGACSLPHPVHASMPADPLRATASAPILSPVQGRPAAGRPTRRPGKPRTRSGGWEEVPAADG
jgi:hypothetical protein